MVKTSLFFNVNFHSEKLVPWLTFNPGLALTAFRTTLTQPWCEAALAHMMAAHI